MAFDSYFDRSPIFLDRQSLLDRHRDYKDKFLGPLRGGISVRFHAAAVLPAIIGAAGSLGGGMMAQGGDTKIEQIPRTAGSLAGEDFLRRLLSGTPDMPTQRTAGMTPVQMLIQRLLPGLLGKTGEAGDLASGEYRKTLEGDYDPRTSPYYEGLRQEAERLKKEGVTGLRQRAELGGMLTSSSAGDVEAGFVKQSDSALLQELGKLLETERGRKLLAAEGIQNVESRRLGNVAAVGGIAETARNIEQQRADALYNQALMTTMFPYTYQAGIGEALMTYSPDYAVTQEGGLNLQDIFAPFVERSFDEAFGGGED